MAVTYSSSFAELSKKIKARALDIKKRVEALDGQRVVVGIPGDAEYPNGKKVAEVAELVTYGIRDDGSPSLAGPRRFMYVAGEDNKKKWYRMLQDGVRKSLRGGGTPDLKPVLKEVGEEMKSDIQKTMLDMGIYRTGRMYDSISVLSTE